MADAAPVSASAVLESLPVTRWHWRLVVLVGLGSFFDLYEVFLGGVLAPVLAGEFGLGNVGKAMVISAGFAGMFVGANVLSIAADRLGRRRIFIINLLVYSLFSLAAAFSPNVETFLILRFLAGIGLGAELVLVDTYLAEFVPARVRGRMTACAYTIGFIGVPLAALLGGKLVARHQMLGIDGWRWLLVFGGLGAVFVLAVRMLLPESPRWLESRGRAAEAREVVASVVAKVAPNTPVPETRARPADSSDEAHSVAEVLRIAFRDYRPRSVMLVIFQVLQTIAYYGFGTLAPLVLVNKGFEVTESLGYAALTFAGYPIGSLVSIPLVERFERKFLIIASALGIAVCGIVFAAADNVVLIVVAGFPAHRRLQRLLQCVPHLPGRDLPDGDPDHGQRHRVFAVARHLDRAAIRGGARARGLRPGGRVLRFGGADRVAVHRRRLARAAQHRPHPGRGSTHFVRIIGTA